MNNQAKFEMVKPTQTIRHNGHDLSLAKGPRGAELWVVWTGMGLEHEVYNKDLKKIAIVADPRD